MGLVLAGGVLWITLVLLAGVIRVIQHFRGNGRYGLLGRQGTGDNDTGAQSGSSDGRSVL